MLGAIWSAPAFPASDVPTEFQSIVDQGMPGYMIVPPTLLYRPEGIPSHAAYRTLVVADIDGDGSRDMAAIVMKADAGMPPQDGRAAGVLFCFAIDHRIPVCRLRAWGELGFPLNKHLMIVPANARLHCLGRSLFRLAEVSGMSIRDSDKERDLGAATVRSKTIGVAEYRILGGGDVVLLYESRAAVLQCITSD